MILKIKPRIKPTSGPFHGKPIHLENALETTYQLVDYFHALKRNTERLPKKPLIDLVQLLRCNEITRHYYTYVNLQLQGISYKRNYLTDDEVIFTWMAAHKGASDRPILKVGSFTLNMYKEEPGPRT